MTRTTSRLANDAWEGLLTAHAELMRRFSTSDVWDGLSMREYDVLYTLSKCQDPLRQGELDRHVLLSQPAISRLVQRLIDRGLIARSVDPVDGRGILLALTEDGRAIQRRIGGRHAVDVAKTVSGRLTPAELEELERLMRKLAQPEHDQAKPARPENEGRTS